MAALDSKADYIELKNQPLMVNAAHMKELRDAVFRYFGVSEAIVMGNYTEDQWNAFYESTIEPLAVQMSLEFTASCSPTARSDMVMRSYLRLTGSSMRRCARSGGSSSLWIVAL